MELKEQIARISKIIVYNEIVSISETIGVELNRSVIEENARKIALDFLEENRLTEPVTLARASFYIAMKDSLNPTLENIKSLIHNNGKTNRWWIYLAPLVEKYSKRG